MFDIVIVHVSNAVFQTFESKTTEYGFTTVNVVCYMVHSLFLVQPFYSIYHIFLLHNQYRFFGIVAFQVGLHLKVVHDGSLFQTKQIG